MDCINNDWLEIDYHNSANNYDKFASLQKNIAEKLFEFEICSLESKNILDIGSGTGYIGELIKNSRLEIDKKNFLQVDLSERMCEIAHKKNGFPIFVGDYNNLVTINKKFDVVFASMSLHWEKSLSMSLKNIFDIVSNNADIYFSIPIESSLIELKNSF